MNTEEVGEHFQKCLCEIRGDINPADKICKL